MIDNNGNNHNDNDGRGDNPFGLRPEGERYAEGRNLGNDPLEGVYAYRPEREGYKSRRVSIRTVLLVVLLLTAAIVWLALPRGADRYENAELPVVRADSEPYKIAPQDRGGMDIPHQDSTVFETLEGDSETRAVETLLPDPEQPIARDDIKVVEEPETVVTTPGLNLDVNLTDKKGEITERAQLIKVPEDTPGQDSAPAALEKETVIAADPEPAVKAPPAPAVKDTAENVEQDNDEGYVLVPKDPVPATAGDATHYIQLGAFRDQDGARKEYEEKKKKYSGLIDSYPVKYEWADLGVKGIFYRLKVGPMAKSEAKSVCEKIKAITPEGCIVAK